MLTPIEHAALIRNRGLPEAVVRIALGGGEAVHPALALQVESVWDPAWTVVAENPGLVPLWSFGTTGVFSAEDGTTSWWSAEQPTEPLETYPDFAGAVKALLTDMWESEESEEDRRAVAELLLPEADVESALVPFER